MGCLATESSEKKYKESPIDPTRTEIINKPSQNNLDNNKTVILSSDQCFIKHIGTVFKY